MAHVDRAAFSLPLPLPVSFVRFTHCSECKQGIRQEASRPNSRRCSERLGGERAYTGGRANSPVFSGAGNVVLRVVLRTRKLDGTVRLSSEEGKHFVLQARINSTNRRCFTAILAVKKGLSVWFGGLHGRHLPIKVVGLSAVHDNCVKVFAVRPVTS